MNKLDKALDILDTIAYYAEYAAAVLLSLMILIGIIITGYFVGIGFYIGLAMGIMIGMIILWLVIDSKFYLARKGK